MMPSQEEALRIKKRVPPNTTEEQRWNEVYLVLFPGETGALPSPCKFGCTPHQPYTLLSSSLLGTSPVTARLTCFIQSTRTNKLRHACPKIPNNRTHPTPGSAVPPSTRDI